MKALKYSLTLVMLVAGVVSALAQVPKQLPDFKFYQLDSKPFTKSNLQKGRTSVFILFDSGCEHCQKEIPAIGKKVDQLVNCSFYFVSFNEPAQISGFMRTYGKDFHGKKNVSVLHDSERQFLPTFFPTKFPAVYMYSKKGSLVYYNSGNQDPNAMVKAASSNRY